MECVVSTGTSSGSGPGSKPFVSWELPTDLVLAIAGIITVEHSPFYDDSDLARDAAACVCVGNSTFSELGEVIFRFLSPRFGENPGVSDHSSVAELKAVLKSWGRIIGGKKAAMWARIQDEVEGDGCGGGGDGAGGPTSSGAAKRRRGGGGVKKASQAKRRRGGSDNDEEDDPGGDDDDEDGAHQPPAAAGRQSRCPVARGPKRRIREQQAARVSKTRAKEVYGVTASSLRDLPTEMAYQAPFGLVLTYSVRDIKHIARRWYCSYTQLQSSQQSSREWSENYNNTQADRKARVVAVLVGRGLPEDDAKRASEHFWHLPFYTEFRPGAGAENATDAWLKAGAEAAADECHTWLFHLARTNYPAHLLRLRETHVYVKASKYRQDMALEKRAFNLALQDWVSGRSLEDVMSHPALPAHMHPAAEQAWHAAKRERERRQEAAAVASAAAGGAGPSSGLAATAAGGGSGGGGGGFERNCLSGLEQQIMRQHIMRQQLLLAMMMMGPAAAAAAATGQAAGPAAGPAAGLLAGATAGAAAGAQGGAAGGTAAAGPATAAQQLGVFDGQHLSSLVGGGAQR